MVDFLNEVPDATESAATFSTFSSTVNPFGRSSFSTSTDNPINCFNSVGQTNFAESQAVISLAELTNEYTAYLILNQSGFNNETIMAATAFQKAFPLTTQPQQVSPNSLTSLLPYANMLALMTGFDTNNLFGNLQVLQAAANAMSSLEQQQQVQLQARQQSLLTLGVSAGATSSVRASNEGPLSSETNNNVQRSDSNLSVKQQMSTTPPFCVDESLQNPISKNKLGRSYNPGRPLAMSDRQRILDLYKKGYKISHIARIIGVTHSCVSKIMTRFRKTGSMHPRSAQIPRKNSSNSSPTCSSTSPFSITESSSIATSSMEFSDSAASSTCSFLVPQIPAAAQPLPTTKSPLLFTITSKGSDPVNLSSTNKAVELSVIQKPIPLKNSACTFN